jgi:hypothetical protein
MGNNRDKKHPKTKRRVPSGMLPLKPPLWEVVKMMMDMVGK